jgi:DNA-binding transcriptional MocR family regulator
MSPDAASADHVYRRVKSEIMSGRYAPGSDPNVHQIALEIGISISPVRDAMERLVGERLLVTRSGGGFQTPAVSEALLRDLYLWHSYLTRGAIRTMPAVAHPDELTRELEGIEPSDNGAIVAATARLFLEFGVTSGNGEHLAAIRSAGERLAFQRLAERQLRDRKRELERLLKLAISGSKAALKEGISVYHRRRLRHVPQIVDALHYVSLRRNCISTP